MRFRLPAGALCALAGCLAAAPAASAESLLSATVSAADGGCSADKRLTMPAAGLVGARLTATAGDWDVSVRDVRTDTTVAASRGFGATEVAEGFLGGGRAFVVQACRRSGSASSARLDVFAQAVPRGTTPASMVEVETPNQAAKDVLTNLPLDLTEHGDEGHVEVVAYGEKDLRVLRDAGLTYRVTVPDLTRRARDDAKADRGFRARSARSSLPSGSNGYRHLWDYEAEMKALAAIEPELVEPITLPQRTHEGRQVHGIEIGADVARADGRPVFLQMGAHHAREWPSAEHAMEWAFELVRGYGRDPEITELMTKVRTIVVPVVNVDGFNLSREAPVDLVEDPEYESLPELTDTAAYLADPAFAYKRRNCRVTPADGAPGGICAAPAFRMSGVDPNRNYGGLWGGPGASALPLYDTYRGPGPNSEPEVQNVRELVSSRQVTTLITNHTFSNLVLRPPGVRAQGPPPDEPIYADLGARMAAQNGYTNQPSYALYDTTGTTEDWSYYATGGLGFTFEIGPDRFHPAYEKTIEEYSRNDGAYRIAMQNAADPSKHSTLAGTAPAGSTLRLQKEFLTETSPVRPAEPDLVDGTPQPEGPKQTFADRLDSSMEVPASGEFEWSINPSTRPIVKERRLPTVSETPSREQTFHNQTQTEPNQIKGVGEPGTYEDIEFNVTAADATKVLAVELTGDVAADDYDLELYRREGGQLVKVGSSGNVANPESIFLDDPATGDYVLRVVNYLAAGPWTVTVKWFQAGPDVITPGRTEAWTLTCERPDGITVSRKLEIERGERKEVAACPAS